MTSVPREARRPYTLYEALSHCVLCLNSEMHGVYAFLLLKGRKSLYIILLQVTINTRLIYESIKLSDADDYHSIEFGKILERKTCNFSPIQHLISLV